MRFKAALRAPSRLRRLWREARTDADMHFGGYVSWGEHLRRHGVGDVMGLDVLDVGGGDRAQLSLLFAADGARVTSLDSLPVALGSRRPRMWAALARAEGPLAAVRAVVRDVLHTFRYWRRLERRAGRRLPFHAVRLIRGDAAQLPFADDSFDIVISSAVWEHLRDVERATEEVSRVLRPSGIAAIQIALFPSLQGGHHPEWHSTNPSLHREIRPWDHLYPDRKKLPTYLNEWSERQYRETLGRSLDVIEWQDDEMRGVEFLTERILGELPEFSRRDLLLSALTAWARPLTTGSRRASEDLGGTDVVP
jgi:SAM-dependent methyltransferase